MNEIENLPVQQPLDIRISDKVDFSTFEEGSNKSVVELLKKAVDSCENEFFFIFGPQGSGKTHLLKSLFQRKKAESPDCCYIDLSLLKTIGAFALDIQIPKALILDNADVIAGNEELELALFALFNRWYDKQEGTLIMSSTKSFDQIEYLKKDLNTRLSSGISLQLNYLTESECVQALQKRIRARYVNLPDQTIKFLVRHCNHDMSSLLAIIDKLENAQLEHTHELTIPFVKIILGIDSKK